MSRFILPTRKGTELYIEQTAIPARVIVFGIDKTGNSWPVPNIYMGQVTTFYWRQKQMAQLSTAPTYVNSEEIGGIKYTLISLYGQDTITVEVPLGEDEKTFRFWPIVIRVSSAAGVVPSIVLDEFEPTNDATRPLREYRTRVNDRAGYLIDPQSMRVAGVFGVEFVAVGEINDEREYDREETIYQYDYARPGSIAVGEITIWDRGPPNVRRDPEPSYNVSLTSSFPNTGAGTQSPRYLEIGGKGFRQDGFEAGNYRAIDGTVLSNPGSGTLTWWSGYQPAGVFMGNNRIQTTGLDYPEWSEQWLTSTALTIEEAAIAIASVPLSHNLIDALTGWDDFGTPLGGPWPVDGPSDTRMHDPYQVTAFFGGITATPSNWWAVETLDPTEFTMVVLEYPGLELDAFWDTIELSGDDDAKIAAYASIMAALEAAEGRVVVLETDRGRVEAVQTHTQQYGPVYSSSGALDVRPEFEIVFPEEVARIRLNITSEAGLTKVVLPEAGQALS